MSQQEEHKIIHFASTQVVFYASANGCTNDPGISLSESAGKICHFPFLPERNMWKYQLLSSENSPSPNFSECSSIIYPKVWTKIDHLAKD